MAGHGKFFVGGNWKCNGTTESLNKLCNDLNAANVPDDIDIVVAPTFLHIQSARDILDKKFVMAAQNCWVGKGGPYTGEVSAEQLHDLGVPWVIVGHSERRALLEEDNDFVGQKAAYALSQDLSVIACIGETLSEREGGKMWDVLTAQLVSIGDSIAGRLVCSLTIPNKQSICKAYNLCCAFGALHDTWPTCRSHVAIYSVHCVTHDMHQREWCHADWDNVVIAYEPVWAIGTGKVATPKQAQEVHAFIRSWFTDKVRYV